MEAIVLAGGFGTRLRKVIADVPKPMAPVDGIPFLHYLLHWLENQHVEKIIISTGFKADIIAGYFGSSFNKIPVEYAVENKPLGTGGAIKYALGKAKENDVLVVNGDTYFPINTGPFLDSHLKSKSGISVALKQMQDFSRYGTVECDESRIIRFVEKKQCSSGLINGGIYLLNTVFFRSLDLPEVFSMEKDVLEVNAGSEILHGFIFNDVFIDIGVPEDYYRAGEIMKKQ